jgi:hypothetical protein
MDTVINPNASLNKEALLAQFKALGGKSYKTESLWDINPIPFIPLATVDGVMFKLQKEKVGPGWQLFMNFGEGCFAEIAIDDRAKAANGYTQWKVSQATAGSEYKGVALTNGTLISLEEYEKNKESLEVIGVTVQTAIDGKERTDKGFVHIPKFNAALPLEGQEKSIKFVAQAV